MPTAPLKAKGSATLHSPPRREGWKHLLGLRNNRKREVKRELNKEKTEDGGSSKGWDGAGSTFQATGDQSDGQKNNTAMEGDRHTWAGAVLQWFLGLAPALSWGWAASLAVRPLEKFCFPHCSSTNAITALVLYVRSFDSLGCPFCSGSPFFHSLPSNINSSITRIKTLHPALRRNECKSICYCW